MKGSGLGWLIGGGMAAAATLFLLPLALFVTAGFAAVTGGGGSSGGGGSLSGDCNYDQILAKVSDGQSEGESTAHGAPQEVPSQYIPFYTKAADDHDLGGCGASILAGIHSIESGFGGDDYTTVNSFGAGGPFQFLESSWPLGADPPGGCGGTWPGYGVEKGACAAANLLHKSGAPGDWKEAIYSYNHADWYVYGVVLQAKHFASQTGSGSTNNESPKAQGPST